MGLSETPGIFYLTQKQGSSGDYHQEEGWGRRETLLPLLQGPEHLGDAEPHSGPDCVSRGDGACSSGAEA